MANKKTNRDFFNEVIALAKDNKELVEWATEQIDKLDTRKANRKPTKTQTENVALKAKIREVLTAIGKPATVTEILTAGNFGVDISNQRVSALLKQMVEVDKTAVKEVDKKKSYFAVAKTEE